MGQDGSGTNETFSQEVVLPIIAPEDVYTDRELRRGDLMPPECGYVKPVCV